MKKMFIMGMPVMLLVFGMAGCDEVLNEPEKGTETEVTGYGITSLDQSAATCTVIFDPQGGDMGNVPKSPDGQVKIFVPVGETAPKPSPDPTKAGYTFGGWYTDTTFKSLYDFNAPVKVGFTLYAKWEPKPCKITYSLNGAPGTPPYPTGYLTTSGQTLTEPPAPQWTGHTFVGWYLNADGTGTAWNFKTDTVTGYITLYAKWTSVAVELDGSFLKVIEDMAEHPGASSMEYTLTGNDEEDYKTPLELTTANSPDSVVIDGGGGVDKAGRLIRGETNSITVGTGVTLTLKNITFETLPFIVAAGGKLILGAKDGSAGDVVIQNNTGTGITVNGDGTLELNAGALVTGNGDSGIVLESNSVLTMTGGTIMNNSASYGGGVAMTGTGGSFTMTGGTISDNTVPSTTGEDTGGGGVAMWGTGGVFTMSGGTISDNEADNGGGVGIWGTNNKFTITVGGTISGNNAKYGGGVHIEGDNCLFTMSGGTISGNDAMHASAGVDIYGSNNTFTMTGGTISGNTSTFFGGGVGIDGAGTTFTMDGGEISWNNAGVDGGGVVLWMNANITFNMRGGSIKNNTANTNGGGLYALATSTFNMTGGEITGNTASGGGGAVVSGTLTGNPQIGGTTPPASGGWIHDNTPNDVSN